MDIKNYKGRIVDMNVEAEVYRNLGSHTKMLWSIRQNGLVVGHANNVMLRDASFIVRKGGQKRVRETRKKNVHAFIRGYLAESGMGVSYKDDVNLAMRVKYDPYNYDSFVTIPRETKIISAWCVKFNNKNVTFAYGSYE